MKLFGGKLKFNLLLIPALIALFLLGQGRALLFYVPALLFHEWSHMLTARALGVRMEKFELLPFGCTARLMGFAISRSREILIAASGPAANMVVASTVFLMDKHLFEIPFAQEFVAANVAIAAINLLPALPLDGGHIARAAFSEYLGQKRATKVTAVMGIVFSAVMIGFGVAVLFAGGVNVGFFIMGLFLCISAIKELRNVPYALIRDVSSKRQKLSKSKTIGINRIAALNSDKLSDVLPSFQAGKYNVLTVVGSDMGKLGELDEKQILQAVMDKGTHVTLGSVLSCQGCTQKPPMLE